MVAEHSGPILMISWNCKRNVIMSLLCNDEMNGTYVTCIFSTLHRNSAHRSECPVP